MSMTPIAPYTLRTRDQLLQWANSEQARGNPVSIQEIAEHVEIMMQRQAEALNERANAMRDDAVRRARRDWAAQASPEIKAGWQAEALEHVISNMPRRVPVEAQLDWLVGEKWKAEEQMRREAEETSNG